jgi:hypothetical protein
MNFFSTVYKTFVLSQKYESAIDAATQSYMAGNGIDEIIDAFARNTDSELDDELCDSIKNYFDISSRYIELASLSCWKGVSFVEENFPSISEQLYNVAVKAEKVVPPAIRALRLGAEKIEMSSDEIEDALAKAGAFFVSLNLKIGNLRHGNKK